MCVALVACTPVDSEPPSWERPTLESIEITPGAPSVKRVLAPTQQLTAIATFSDSSSIDVTEEVTWSSSDPAIAKVTAQGLATAEDTTGATTITATLDEIEGSATLTVNDAMLAVAGYSPPHIEFFPALSNGPLAATRSIAGSMITLTAIWNVTVYDNELYVADADGKGINVYPIDATGDIAPTRRLVGASTQLQRPYGLHVTATEIFVSASGGHVLVYPRADTGDIVPSRDINGPATTLSSDLIGLYIHDNEIFVTSTTGNSIVVFPRNADGNVAPTRVISGVSTMLQQPKGLGVKDGELYVANDGRVTVYPINANGNVAPVRTINTTASYPGAMYILGDELLIASYQGGGAQSTLQVYPANANGAVTPTRIVTGVNSALGVTAF